MVDLTDFSLSVILFCYDEVSLVYYSLKERLKLKRKHKLALSCSNCVIGREIPITFLKELKASLNQIHIPGSFCLLSKLNVSN